MLRFARDPGFLVTAGNEAMVTAREVAGFQTNMEYVQAIFEHLVQDGPLPTEVSLTGLRKPAGGT